MSILPFDCQHAWQLPSIIVLGEKCWSDGTIDIDGVIPRQDHGVDLGDFCRRFGPLEKEWPFFSLKEGLTPPVQERSSQ